MSDIVERLRNLQDQCLHGNRRDLLRISAEAIKEATDMIERCYGAIADLQAEVRRKSEEIEKLHDVLNLYAGVGITEIREWPIDEPRPRPRSR